MELMPQHADIAAALQEATNAAVMALVRRLKREVPLDNLCFAGGVALNCVTNELVRQSCGAEGMNTSENSPDCRTSSLVTQFSATPPAKHQLSTRNSRLRRRTSAMTAALRAS